MEQNTIEYWTSENERAIQFLNESTLAELEKADTNPLIKISIADRSIPFIVLSDGGVVADITANNPKTILKNIQLNSSAGNLGAGFIDVFHGNRTLLFRLVESNIFKKKWWVDDVASTLQQELNLYYPGYQIRSR